MVTSLQHVMVRRMYTERLVATRTITAEQVSGRDIWVPNTFPYEADWIPTVPFPSKRGAFRNFVDGVMDNGRYDQRSDIGFPRA